MESERDEEWRGKESERASERETKRTPIRQRAPLRARVGILEYARACEREHAACLFGAVLLACAVHTLDTTG